MRELEIRLQLEQELHDLQAQIQAKRIAQLEARVNGLQEDNVAKDRELTAAARREAAATAAATTPAPVRLNGAPRKKQTPKTSKKKQSTQRHDHHQQQPLELFMVQQQHPQQPLMLTATVDESIAVTAVNEERIRVREEQERAAIAQAELDGVMEAGLTTFYEAGVNVGTLFDTNIRLSAYLEKFLDATNAPNHNNALRNVIDHIFYAKYRVSIMANMRFFEPQNDQQRTELFMVQKGDVLNRDSPTVRYNISNVTIHAAFIAKAIEFADSPQSSHYTPIIMANFPHRYDPLLVQKWYPFMDSGNGHLVTTDLKIPAVASLQGQGHGKACHYCGLQYIASCNGVLKHTHQVNHCDYIANLSNDERLIITTVLAKCATDEDLAAHPFMANRNEKSLFRLATPFEEQHGRYVLNEATRERLRINMPVLLRMRQETYADFLIRINTLDTHLNREMNLNAKLLTFQFDCFGLNTPSAKKKNTNTNKVPSGKISKEDGFLYKSLLDHQGNQFRKTKFTADGKKTLRDFTTLDAFGFADDMFFSMPAALTPEELNQSADAFLMQNMALMNQLTYTIPQPEQEPFLLLNAAAATTTHEDDSLECHLLVNTEPDNAWQPFAHDPIDAYGYNNNNTSNNEDELAYSFSRQNSF